MPSKDSVWRDLILLLAFCVLVATIFLMFHQIHLLYYIMLACWCMQTLILGIPLIYAGVKELREAHQNGQRIRWNENATIMQGLGFLLPLFFESFRLLHGWSLPEIGPGLAGWQLVKNIIVVIIVYVLFVPWLFLEVGLTIGLIRRYLINANPYTRYLESLTTEDEPYKEQPSAQDKVEISE
jgi:hypothetical protein